MAFKITMPKLSDTMTEGLFAGWKKNVGDHIERGDVIAEVETDKAVMDLEAFASGTLLKIMYRGGDMVPVGTILGLIGKADEIVPEDAVPPPVVPLKQTGPVAGASRLESPAAGSTEKSSPLVRRMAREQHISLEQVAGSGPEGRITQDDLSVFATLQGEKREPVSVPSAEASETAATGKGSASAMRQAIAATVTHSWQTIPHFSVTVEINMEGCRKIVSDLKDYISPIGYNTLVIKACACALQKFPLLRIIDPEAPDEINISFAVSLPDGLLMPVIRHCQELSAAHIEIEVSRLADRCRAGRLTQKEMTGGHFSVSNLGMFGVDEFTALIMPGQTAILAVGAVHDSPSVCEGKLVATRIMRVTLSSDHRIVDGSYAASFLKQLQTVLEKPSALLM